MLKSIFDKILGGRWIATVAIIFTYCYAIVKVVNMVEQKIMSLDVFLGMFAAFALLAKEIVNGYFQRSDRTIEGTAQVTETTQTTTTQPTGAETK